MRTEFIERFPLSALTPADYNPRRLDTEKFERLKDSLRRFGVIKPVIVNGANGVLTAGHQRTRAMKAIGMEYAPAIRITKPIKVQDEIRFNLFHNSIETGCSSAWISGALPRGYSIVAADRIEHGGNKNALVVDGIGRLIIKYGEWGSIVADENGNVIINSDYAVAAKMLGVPVICYTVAAEQVQDILDYLSDDYGAYCYDALGIKSYNQLYCQMNRLAGKQQFKSSTYEYYVIPRLRKDMRILDFGAGRCAYVNRLRGQGYKILAYEPHLQGERNNIDMRGVVAQIRAIQRDVEAHGLYDMVVLDSVLNSVVNTAFEDYVLTVCNAMLSGGGALIVGTRNLEMVEGLKRQKKVNTRVRGLQFLDDNNFTATYRDGVWTMQHFHTLETLRATLSRYFGNVETMQYSTTERTNIYAIARAPIRLSREVYETALNVEYNMEYPNNYRHNAHAGLVAAVLNCLQKAE